MSCQVVPSLLVRWYCDELMALAGFAPDGNSWTIKLLGENLPPIGPAPATIVAPLAFLFVFHCSLTVYVTPWVRGTTVWAMAALGEKVPAKPPLSFQASGCPAVVGNAPPEMVMPRSWL